MPISPGKVPRKAIAEFRRVIDERCATRGFATSNLCAIDTDALYSSIPHQVAYLPLDEIRPNIDLRNTAKKAGWRFLIHESSGAVAAARIIGDDENGYHLSEITEGPFIANTETAILRAAKLKVVREGLFEAMFLLVPDVYVAALWLENLKGGDDLILTVPPSNPKLKEYEPMEVTSFLNVLRGRITKIRRDASLFG